MDGEWMGIGDVFSKISKILLKSFSLPPLLRSLIDKLQDCHNINEGAKNIKMHCLLSNPPSANLTLNRLLMA